MAEVLIVRSCCLQESLRKYAPAPGIIRTPLEDTEIRLPQYGDKVIKIRAGELVSVMMGNGDSIPSGSIRCAAIQRRATGRTEAAKLPGIWHRRSFLHRGRVCAGRGAHQLRCVTEMDMEKNALKFQLNNDLIDIFCFYFLF